MKVKEIQVDMTYNLGNDESKKLSLSIELEENDLVSETYSHSQELLAQLISNGNPEVYKICMEKLGGNFTADNYQDVLRQWQENCQKIKELKKYLLASQEWLSSFIKAKKQVDKLKQAFDHSNDWNKFNQTLSALANFNLEKKINDFCLSDSYTKGNSIDLDEDLMQLK